MSISGQEQSDTKHGYYPLRKVDRALLCQVKDLIKPSSNAYLYLYLSLASLASYSDYISATGNDTIKVNVGGNCLKAKELADYVGLRDTHLLYSMLKKLEKMELITYTRLKRGYVVYNVNDFRKNNKPTKMIRHIHHGFYFVSEKIVTKIAKMAKSIALSDLYLYFWLLSEKNNQFIPLSEVYSVAIINDAQRKANTPITSLSMISEFFGVSKSTISEKVNKLCKLKLISFVTLPENLGSIIVTNTPEKQCSVDVSVVYSYFNIKTEYDDCESINHEECLAEISINGSFKNKFTDALNKTIKGILYWLKRKRMYYGRDKIKVQIDFDSIILLNQSRNTYYKRIEYALCTY